MTISNNLIEVVDIGLLALDRVNAIFIAIDALDLGVGGKHYTLLCELRDIGVTTINDAQESLRAISVTGEAA